MTKSIYGCHDLPLRRDDAEYSVQDGWLYEAGAGNTITRLPVMKRQPNVNTRPCAYENSGADAQCAGCWQRRLLGMFKAGTDQKGQP